MSIGPDWGNAHIDVHADTSPMRRELRAAATAAGKEFGSDWGKAAETELGKELTVLGRHIETALKKSGKAGGTDWASAYEDAVRSRLRRFNMNVINASLTGDWSFAIEQFGGLEQAIEGVNAKIAQMRSESDLSEAAFQDIEGSLRKWTQSVRNDNAFQALHESALKMHVEWTRQKKEAEDFQKALTQAYNDIEDAAHKANKEFDRTSTAKAREEYKALHRESRALHTEITKMLRAHDAEDRALQRTRDSAHDVALAYRKISTESRKVVRNFSLMGRLKGSRNNFLNLLGSMGVAVENFGDKLVGAFSSGGVTRAFQTFFANFQGVGAVFKDQGLLAGLKQFGEAFEGGLLGGLKGGKSGGIAGAVSGIILGLVQIGQAIAGVVLAIGTLNIVAPAITGLAGIVAALAASLSYAIAGFLLPLGPMALAAAGAVGALVVAFKDAGERAEDATKPFKDFFAEIKGPVQDALFLNLARDAETFKSVLNNFVGPLLIESAAALSGVITYMAEAFQREDVQRTLEILGNTLPPILSNLGQGFTDLITGLLGFFAPISGFTVGITQNLADMALEFSNWANSTEGQDSIRNFFSEATVSAQILWDLVKNLGIALGLLFSQGKETGDQFLQKIVDIVGEFNTWADSDEGREKIAGWMAFAKDLADKLWAAVETIGDAIQKLDTAPNRRALLSLIDAFTAILDAIGRVADAVSGLAPLFNGAFAFIAGVADQVADAIEGIAGAVKSVIGALGRITVPSALRSIVELIGKINGSGVKVPNTAAGGVFHSAQVRRIGEAGTEAVVPLDRPLNMVDPSVRWMSALIQGKGGAMGSQGSGAGGRMITVMPGAVTVSAPVRNEALVANMVIDGLVARVK